MRESEMGLFYRWAPSEHAEKAIENGLVSHNGSAMWIFSLASVYRPGAAISKDACLIAYDLDAIATNNVQSVEHIDFEAENFTGENGHPRQIIVKNNEPGAYGIGRGRQAATNHHAKTRYATKKEVARALGLKEIETAVGTHKPPGVRVW
jgi:hypothetical protein